MSWPLAAYGLLALALAAGFAWYERTRPDARIVALVGTLAAFAALGRMAFAALPNVKPTTDIVLASGYALGGAPGFVVGAVAALASNFFFGQGAWTPWQMAGWGATGVLGALLGRLTRGRIGRWPLAGVCCAVGFGFTALQDVGDWVTYSDHSLAQLGVIVGKGLGFDAVHAAGCLGFALLFGPALVRSLQRFRLRLTPRWVRPGPSVAALAAAVVTTGLVLQLAPARASASVSPLGYLASVQNADGGFGATAGASSSTMFSGWAALAFEAGGVNPAGVSRGGPSLLAYLQGTASEERDPGSLERTILALRGADAPAGALLARLRADVRRDGSVQEQTNLTAFAVLAFRAGGLAPPPATLDWLVRQQDADGGFNFATAGGQSEADDTGAALEALAGTGHTAAVRRAVRFLATQENRDGGFPSTPGGDSNAQSTAFAVQGLLAAGAPAARGQAYLRALTAPDGHVRYARGSDQTPVWVTAEAELALAGRPLPLAPVPLPRSAPAVPVAPKPPAQRPRATRRARRRSTVTHAREIRHTRRPRPARHEVHRAAPALVPSPQTLAEAAGTLTALVLAPVENP